MPELSANPTNSPLSLHLEPDVRKAVETELCRRVSSAVEDCLDRNEFLAIWRDQIEGLGQSANNGRTRGSCDLNDSITLEAHLDLVSNLTQSLHREPLTAVEAFTGEDEESARLIEEYCAVETNRQDLHSLFYDAAHNVSRDVAVPIYCGWKWSEREERGTGFRRKGSEDVVEADQQMDGEEYEEVPLTKSVTESGYDLRVVSLADFFPYPANAPTLDKTVLVAERFTCTEDALYDGIDDFGYSEEAVEQLVALGPNEADGGETSDYKQSQDDSDGVQPAGDRDGYYELFTVFCRLPRRCGSHRVPDYLRNDWFLAVLCPGKNLVLKLDFSPYRDCPYFLGYMLPKPASLSGYCIPSLLEPIQAEANANLRFTIDSMNLTMSPALKVLESEASKYNKWSLYPGAIFPVKEMNEVEPLEWNRAPLRDGLTYQQWLETRGKSIVSAPGAGQFQAKVRKKDEVQAVEQQSASKFGLYLWNFQRTVVGPLFQRLIALKQQFGGVDEDEGEDFVNSDGKASKLTLKALRGKYRFVPAVTSLTYSPEARIEVDKAVEAIVSGYIQAVTTLPPQFHSQVWHLARRRLYNLGEHNPKALLGPEPPDQQAAPPPAEPPQPGQPPAGGPGAGAPPQVTAGGGDVG